MRIAAVLVAVLLLSAGLSAAQGAPRIQASAALQMQAIQDIKMSKTPAQAKIGSRLFMAILKQRGDSRLTALPDFRFVMPDADGKIAVDIEARKTSDVKGVMNRVVNAGGEVQSFHYRYRGVRARLPLTAVEGLAGFAGVRKIQLAEKGYTHAINTSEGDVAHRAAEARGFFGVNGTGVKICVLSDGVDSLAALQASGDLPAVVDVLPGQAGSGDEGSAMLEIVHDLAPGADLGFATALPTQLQFATNILGLAADGCHIIVDDIIYLAESPFQDNTVADAVNQVTAAGVLYFSSAGNEGSLKDATSGTWEGDFDASALALPPVMAGAGIAHDFGDGGQSQLVTADGAVVVLHWTDVFGASGNDYDVYDLDGGLTTIFDASTDIQSGTEDPVEISGFSLSGERLMVMQFAGADRMINLINFRGIVENQTSGATRGHSAAADAMSVAAVDVATASGGPFTGGGANPAELFSSDGPRRIFYDFAGNFLPGAPPGNTSETGGVIRQKPDIAAADGVATAAPGFNPFFGTSAAAPHAAAIAGLVKQAFPAMTAAQINAALEGSALDIEAPGVDISSGAGLVMAYETLEDNGATPQAFLDDGTPVYAVVGGDVDAFVETGEDWSVTIPLTNIGGANATAISAVLSSPTPGVVMLSDTSAYVNLVSARPSGLTGGGTASNTTPYVFTTTGAVACGSVINFILTVTYTGGVASPQTFDYALTTGAPGTPVTFSYIGPVVPIPDAADLSGSSPGAPVVANLPVAAVVGNVYDVDLRIDGATCNATAGSTTVGIDHTFVNDLELTLIGPGGIPTRLVVDNTDGSDNNFCQTVLDDEAVPATSIQSVTVGQAPFTGNFTPNQSLSIFDGASPNGTWALQAQDFFQFDTGSIRAFSLIITPAVCDAPALTTNVTATKAVTGGTLVPGGTVIYTITLTNTGTGTQPNNAGAEFTDDLTALQPGLTFAAVPPGAAAPAPVPSSGSATTDGVSVLSWNGSIPPGGSVTIIVTANIQLGTGGLTLLNQGTVSSDANRDFTNDTTTPTDNPGGALNDPTPVTIGGGVVIQEIPTLSEIGLALLVLMLSTAAVLLLRRRTPSTGA